MRLEYNPAFGDFAKCSRCRHNYREHFTSINKNATCCTCDRFISSTAELIPEQIVVNRVETVPRIAVVAPDADGVTNILARLTEMERKVAVLEKKTQHLPPSM